MSLLNYENTEFVGVVKQQYNNADIHIVGYIDDRYHFIGCTESEAIDVFKPKGKIFAPGLGKCLQYVNNLVYCCIKPSDNYEVGNTKLDKYVLNNKPEIYDSTPIKNIENKTIEEGSNQNADFFNELDSKHKYYRCQDRIYYLDEKDLSKGLVKFWILDDDFRTKNINKICGYDNCFFIIGDDIEDSSYKYLDILNDKELITYVISIIKKHNITPDNIENLDLKLLKKLDIPEDILASRYKRFEKLLEKVTLTHKIIFDLSQNPLLSKVLENSIKEYEEDYIKTFEEKNKAEIEALEKDLEQQKRAFAEVLKKEEAELEEQHSAKKELLNVELTEKEDLLNELTRDVEKQIECAEDLDLKIKKLEEHKERIIQDYRIVNEVMAKNNYIHEKEPNEVSTPIDSFTREGEEISDFKSLRSLLEICLKENKLKTDISKEIISLFLTSKVLLMPDIRMIKSLIDAIGKCNVLSVSVGVNWKTYDDLWNSGLKEMLTSCSKYPNTIHVLVLQNMNLSYIPCYMSPINDVIIGLKRSLPGDVIFNGLPANLWIIGTRTQEEALTIPLESIREYGCLANKDYSEKEEVAEEAVSIEPRYLTMEVLERMKKDHRDKLEAKSESKPETYLDE